MKTGTQRKTLQYRSFVLTLSVSLTLILLTLGLTFAFTLRSVSQTSETYLTSYIRYASDSFHQKLNDAVLLSHTIASDEKMIRSSVVHSYPEASYRWFQEQLSIRSYLNTMIVGKNYISHLALVLPGYTIFSSGNTLFWHDIENEWIDIGREALRILYDPQNNLILISRPFTIHQEALGTILIMMDMTSMCSDYDIQPLEKAETYVFSPDHKMIYGPERDGKEPNDGETEKMENGFSWRENKLYRVLRYSNPVSGIVTISLIPIESFLENVIQWARFSLFLILLAIVLAVLVSRFFGKALFQNLNILMDCMKKVRNGDLSQRAVVSSHDEIGEAADSFNRTMMHIEKLTQDIRTQEKEKRQAEQQALEAQIRPHFVYNSISAMQYAAENQEQREIASAARALGMLMRSVLGNHNSFITLWEEKNYIDSYVFLQRFKFKNDFSLNWDVDEKLWTMLLPKLLLQPLVENALLHGIRFSSEGSITISVHPDSLSRVFIRVIDNGIGMTREQIANLLEKEEENPSSFRNVGIHNVMERIQLYYHGNGEFNIFSEPGKFTVVELLIPLGKGELDE